MRACDRLLVGGETVAAGSLEIRILETPGHTRASRPSNGRRYLTIPLDLKKDTQNDGTPV